MMDEKPQQWRDLTVRISGIADKLGMPIDAGIRETVIALNALGFTTRQSCESHLDHGTGAPWVDVISTSTKIYEDRQVPYDRRLVIQSLSSGIYRLESQGAELLETAPREIGQPKLQEYQEEIQAFTRFLEEIYFSEDASTSSSWQAFS